MHVNCLVLGSFETNSYVVTKDHASRDCLIIDTGLDARPLVKYLEDNQLIPEAVILTHGHADHIAGIKSIRENWPDVKVVIHKNDAEMLTRPSKNLSPLAGMMFKTLPAEMIIEKECTLSFAGITLDVLHTPGHTPGGICLYSKEDNAVFAGDTLFAGSIGRTDFPSGSFEQLMESIQSRLLVLPESTIVYTGHGPQTTIQQEKMTNQYLS